MNPARTIRIVEDDRDIRDVLADILVDEGYHVLLAEDGLEGLQRLRDGPQPALILLDLMMPRMDGFQFRDEQRRRPEWRDIPVVLLTAGGDLPDKARQLDAADALRKPVKLESLLEMIDRFTPPLRAPAPPGA